MPAIASNQLNCSVYCYRSEMDAKDGANTGGSGFLVGMPALVGEHVYAVTNKHVLDNGCHVLRINTHEGSFDTVSTKPDDWAYATDDDLAVLRINLEERFAWDRIHASSFLTPGEVWPPHGDQDLSFGYGDEVVFIGRVISHDGRQRNRPAVRFGNIAMLPDDRDPVVMPTGPQVGFLVDCRSLPGASGSAALAYLVSERPGGINLMGGGHRGVLLGVDCGHLPRWAKVYDRDLRTELPYRVEMNSGISVVVPAWRLLALLEREDLRKDREQADDAVMGESAAESMGLGPGPNRGSNQPAE